MNAVAKASIEDDEPLQIVSLDGFMKTEMPLPKYAIERLLPFGHVSLLGAHGGAGKSILALTWAAHFADGSRWNGLPVEFGPAAYCSLEDPATVVKLRLQRIVRAYSLDEVNVSRNLLILDGTAASASLGAETTTFGAREFGPTTAFFDLQAKAAGCRFIVIDNASDAFDGNENERRSVRAFVRMLAKLARANDAAVLLLAHVDKAAARNGANGNTYSGSTAWHNSTRSRMALVPSNRDVELIHEKHNLGPLAEPALLTWNASGVLMPCAPRTPEDRTSHDEADDEGMIEAFKAAAKAGTSIPVSRVGAITAHTTLKTFSSLPDALKQSRPRFWASIDRLSALRRIERETYQNGQRKNRERMVLR